MTDVLTRVPTRQVEPTLAGTAAERLMVLVAPTTGRFRPEAGIVPGSAMAVGSLIGHITGGRGRADEVVLPADAALRMLLVRQGQLVTAGQGLAWMERA